MFKREFRLESAELRGAMSATGDMVISGYVNKTGEQSVALPTGFGNEFYEVIEKGAFQRAVDRALNSGSHIDFLAEHDHEKILSSTKNSSLILKEDQNGLYMSAIVANTSWGRDFYSLVKSGIINSFSFGFRAVDDEWEEGNDGTLYRTVHDLDLFEVSLVRHPAYEQSFAEARGLQTIEETIEEGHRRLKMKKEKEVREETVEEEEVEETEKVESEERDTKEDVEIREDTEDSEDEESVLDVTESILAIDTKLETITAKLDEVLGIFLDNREEEIEEPIEEEEEIEEEPEEDIEDRNKEIVEEALKELASILENDKEEEIK